MRLGIYGGSFNPPHLDHFTIGKYLLAYDYVDKVVYVPTGNCYSKSDLIDFTYRRDMLKLMLEGDKRFSVSSYEAQQQVVFTYQTLDYFRDTYHAYEIYFICGSDNLQELSTWKCYQYILENYKILAIQRNGDFLCDLISSYGAYSSSIKECNIPLLGLSSTYIRSLLRSDIVMEKLVDYVSLPVLEYIKEKRLYRK